ncbi:glycosyltransferase family 2 protein [Fulvivirga sp. RKSG066]|uniref:glycosyltransferase family 2 protein n=1 Tax=Fulvivirga aurantia TaxID=2529383 RepID=UPI0012BC9FA9|nr:glycosyltransferase family 2 protein [Fulvivirga aurantia]MTI21980.1 glycosyltransferase family 2 protein [Fulvivirga aurantia]
MSNTAVKISGVIITYNEERHIEACIKSMQPVVDEILVVDSYSTDQTKEISQSLGVTFIENTFEGHIEQKNFAMKQAKHDLILSLDADERVSDKMRESVLKVKQECIADGYVFNRFNNYCGKWLKYSWYPDRKLRLWNRNKGGWGGTNPHDKVILDNGSKVVKLKGDLLHYAYADVNEHLDQIRKFSIIAAQAKYKKGKQVNFLFHVLINPMFKFSRKYFFNLGFLDGYYGFIFSFMSAYLNFLKYVNIWEMQRTKKEE